MAFTIQLRDAATAALERARASMSQKAGTDGVAMVAARALVNLVRAHLFRLNRERPNKLGGKRTNFWTAVGRSVQAPRVVSRVSDKSEGALISINHVGIAQRYFGGRIEAKPGKYLTIPARAKYHGRRAREFQNLHVVKFKRGTLALAEADATQVAFRKTKKGTKVVQGTRQGGPAYWLKKWVFQKEDKSVLPTQKEMQDAADAAAQSYLERQKARTQT